MRIPAVWILLAVSVCAQTPDAGRRVFESRCARCHGPEGGGGELGPAIAARVAARSDQELSALIAAGSPGRGMPAFELPPAELNNLVSFLRSLAPPPGRPGIPVVRKTVTITDGQTLTGSVINESSLELQLRTDDNRINLL